MSYDPVNTVEALVAEVLLDETRASDGTFSQISVASGEYDFIEVYASLRSDINSGGDTVLIAFNSDTTNSNYIRELHIWGQNGSTHTGGGAADRLCLRASGSTAGNDANAFTISKCVIAGLSNSNAWTTYRTMIGQFRVTSVSDAYVEDWTGAWHNTANVTTIDFTLSGGTNFKAGSQLKVVGYKKRNVAYLG